MLSVILILDLVIIATSILGVITNETSIHHICLSVCPAIHLSVCPSFHLCVCLSVHPFICLSVCLSVHSSVCLSVCPFICLSVCLPFFPLLSLPSHLPVSVYQSITSVSIHLTLSSSESVSQRIQRDVVLFICTASVSIIQMTLLNAMTNSCSHSYTTVLHIILFVCLYVCLSVCLLVHPFAYFQYD